MAEGEQSVAELVGQLAGQIQQLTAAQRQQQATIAQLAQGTQAAAQAANYTAQRLSQPPPVAADEHARLNERYLQALAIDPTALRNAENAQIKREIAEMVQQQLQQTVGQVEQKRQVDELQREVYRQNPDIIPLASVFNDYLNYLNRNQEAAGMDYRQKIQTAVQWTREHHADLQSQWQAQQEQQRRQQARASAPGGGSYSDPGTADAQPDVVSEEVAHHARLQLLEGKKAAAMGGGGYTRK